MKLIFILTSLLLLNNCSLNQDSKYWTEDAEKRKGDQKKINGCFNKGLRYNNYDTRRIRNLYR